MADIITKINDLCWGVPMIIFLLGSHIYLTFRTGFVQKHIFKGIKLSLNNKKTDRGDLSIFGSLMTALSSTIGTGNIIGVGTAIVYGGPGAVLWTWIGGLFGIATKYAESYIATKYRQKNDDGSYIGGAMTTLKAMNLPFLATLFALFCALGAFGIGCSTQASAIVDVLTSNYDISKYIIGAIICLLTFIVIFGGVKSIAKVCNQLVPIMSIVYVLGCIIILVVNLRYLPATISLIVSSAFSKKAMTGGFIGSTIMIAARYGIARGLFSNEAGMGSAPIATAAGSNENAVKPALIGSTGVFWDTIVVCLMTGLVLVSSVIANPNISAKGVSGGALVTSCFNTIPYIGKGLLIFGILTFAFSTILGWSYYGERCISYLFGTKAITFYRALWIIVIFVGSVSSLDTVWAVADILNALMCIPNMIAVLLLTKQIKKDTDYYLNENHLDDIDSEMK